jgi:hypothetical protein
LPQQFKTDRCTLDNDDLSATTQGSTMKKLATIIALGLSLSLGATHAADVQTDCAAKAAEKKLAGAAKASFEKKCIATAGDAAPTASSACEKSAADKKLAGAAKNSHIKKCMSEEKTSTAPEAAGKPAAVASGSKK